MVLNELEIMCSTVARDYLTNTLDSKYFESLFFCVAPMPATNFS